MMGVISHLNLYLAKIRMMDFLSCNNFVLEIFGPSTHQWTTYLKMYSSLMVQPPPEHSIPTPLHYLSIGSSDSDIDYPAVNVPWSIHAWTQHDLSLFFFVLEALCWMEDWMDSANMLLLQLQALQHIIKPTKHKVVGNYWHTVWERSMILKPTIILDWFGIITTTIMY